MRTDRRYNERARSLAVIFFLVFTAILVKLFFIQVVHAEILSEKGLDQRLKEIPFQPKRGTIHDRDGNELALTIETARIIANPRIMPEPQEVAVDLAPILGTSDAVMKEKFRSGSGYVLLKKLASKDVGLAVKKLVKSDKQKYNGITIEETKKRFYPYSMMAGQTVGYADTNGKGISGIEKYYDNVLRGEKGYLKTELDRSGRPIPNGIRKMKQTKDGSDLWLTLDRDIQQKAESELDMMKQEYGYKRAAIVVMDASSGELLAMAMRPGIDLNDFEKYTFEDLKNFVVQDAYEPGSVFKPITASGALDEGLVNENTTMFLPSTMRIGGFTIGESHPRPAQNFTFPEIISLSSNIGAIKLSQLLGKEKFYDHITKYGFGKRSGVDLPSEGKGILMDVKDWETTRGPTISFGQGITVNALQLSAFYSAVANGGMSVRPHLLKEARDSEGNLISVPQVTKDVTSSDVRIMSEDTALRMQKILQKTVIDGTGISAAMDQYTSGGKTGTAKIPEPTGGYGRRYISSFIGFAPVTKPKLVVLVVVEEPQKAFYGSVVAAPYFSKVTDYALKKLNITPDKFASEDIGQNKNVKAIKD